jgi:hypothetical protein
MVRRVLAIFGLISFLAVSQQSQAAPILTNGDFESPTNTPHYNIPAGDSTSITGWTVTQGNVDLTNSSTNFYAHSGSQDVDLVGDNTLGPVGAHGATGIGGLKQTFTTTSGQTYQITLWYSHNYGASYGDGTTITSASASISVTDSALLSLLAASITDTSTWPGCSTNQPQCVVWTEYTGTFTADSASTILTINNTAGGRNGGIYLDNVDIEPLNAGQTPLPGALPLFASGLGALGLLARRRKRKNTAALAVA